MENQFLSKNKRTARRDKGQTLDAFPLMAVILLLVVVGSIVFLSLYQPAPSVQPSKITLEQKMAYLQSGTPLPGQQTKASVPRWMMLIILGFVVLQVFPLVLAAHKARLPHLNPRDLRQIEFFCEVPLFLGLLGSLLGVCMTHFVSGTLSAPLAYLTTISGILIYLFGRFTILMALPSSTETIAE